MSEKFRFLFCIAICCTLATSQSCALVSAQTNPEFAEEIAAASKAKATGNLADAKEKFNDIWKKLSLLKRRNLYLEASVLNSLSDLEDDKTKSVLQQRESLKIYQSCEKPIVDVVSALQHRLVVKILNQDSLSSEDLSEAVTLTSKNVALLDPTTAIEPKTISRFHFAIDKLKKKDTSASRVAGEQLTDQVVEILKPASDAIEKIKVSGHFKNQDFSDLLGASQSRSLITKNGGIKVLEESWISLISDIASLRLASYAKLKYLTNLALDLDQLRRKDGGDIDPKLSTRIASALFATNQRELALQYVEESSRQCSEDSKVHSDALIELVEVCLTQRQWELPSKELRRHNNKLAAIPQLSSRARSLIAASNQELTGSANFQNALALTYRALKDEEVHTDVKYLNGVWTIWRMLYYCSMYSESRDLLSRVSANVVSNDENKAMVDRIKSDAEKLEKRQSEFDVYKRQAKFFSEYYQQMLDLGKANEYAKAAKLGHEGVSYFENEKLPVKALNYHFAEYLHDLASMELQLGNFEQCIVLAEKGKKLAEDSSPLEGLLEKLETLARTRSAELSKFSLDSNREISRLLNTVDIQLRQEGSDVRSIESLLSTAYGLIEQNQNVSDKASQLSDIATSYQKIGKLEKSFQCEKEAFKILGFEKCKQITTDKEAIHHLLLIERAVNTNHQVSSDLLNRAKNVLRADVSPLVKAACITTLMPVIIESEDQDSESNKQFVRNCVQFCEMMNATIERIYALKEWKRQQSEWDKLGPKDSRDDLFSALLRAGRDSVVGAIGHEKSTYHSAVVSLETFLERGFGNEGERRDITEFLLRVYFKDSRFDDAERFAQKLIKWTDSNSSQSALVAEANRKLNMSAKITLANIKSAKGEQQKALDILNDILIQLNAKPNILEQIKVLRLAANTASLWDADLAKMYSEQCLNLIAKDEYAGSAEDIPLILMAYAGKMSDEKTLAICYKKTQSQAQMKHPDQPYSESEANAKMFLLFSRCDILLALGRFDDPEIDSLLDLDTNKLSTEALSRAGKILRRKFKVLKIKVLLRRGEVDSAKLELDKFAQLLMSELQSVGRSASFDQLCCYIEAEFPVLTECLIRCAESDSDVDWSYNRLLNIKGLVGDALQSHVSKSITPEQKKLRGLHAQIAGWAVQRLIVPADAWRYINEKLNLEVEALEKSQNKIRLEAPKFDSDILSRVQQNLKKDETLVDIYQVSEYTFLGNYYAFLVKPGEKARLVKVGGVSDVDAAVRNLLESSEDNNGYRTISTLKSQKVPSSSGGQILAFDELELVRLLRNEVKVWISPDGELGTVPWQFVLGQSPTNKGVCILDSPRRLVQLRNFQSRAEKGKTMFALGGLEFTERQLELKGSLDEVNSISALAKEHNWKVDLLTGASATKESVISGLSTCQIAHFATHGFFSPLSRVDLASEINRSISATGARMLVPSTQMKPMVTSGILLSGDHSENRIIAQNDRLSAAELLGLDLRQCELITVSACVSGRGESLAGQGLLGLQSAFLAGGARCLLLSLWDVPDISTKKLMQEFYKNLFQNGMSKVDALRAAQSTLRSEGAAKVKDWAGWALVGDGF